jgi:predicted permease
VPAFLRFLAKAPGFTSVAVLTLAVAIGANTSIFSVTNALLLRPLAFADPDRLVTMSSHRQGQSGRGPLTYPRFQLVSENAHSFSGIAAYCNETFNLTGQGDPEQIPSARVSWNFFRILGVTPAMGRAFRLEEDRAGGDNVVVITDSLWERRFARDRNVLGHVLTLDGKDYSVIGVLPPDFRFAFLGRSDLYAPRVFDLNAITPQQVAGGSGFLDYLARLAPNVSLTAAQSELDALAVSYRQQYPKFPDADPALVVHAGILRDEMVSSVRVAVLVLLAAVSVVLLIACANVASLLLSRALRRKQEIAVRIAIGATRGDIVRQLLKESLTLAAIGGAFGLLLSYWGTRALASLAEGTLPRAAEIGIDARVLAFTAVASIVAGVIFGLIPALQVSRPDLNNVLRSEGGRGATGGRRHHAMRTLLVVSQVALSTVLLIGAGLLLRNFLQLQTTSAGFDTAHLLTMNITLPPARYSGAAKFTAFTDELLRQVRRLPGVRSAAVASALPVNPTRFSPALPEGQPQVPLAERPILNIQMVSEGYATTMRIPLKRGREFTDRDDAPAPKVAMVNETLARRYWGGQDAIGKHILLGRLPAPIEVVGVLGDVRNISIASDVQPEILVPWAQLPWANIHLILRTAADPLAASNAVRAAVLAVDKDQPVTKVRVMEELFEQSAAQPRFTAYLLGALAAAALLLAMVGIYGVIAYTVAERTQEMGIRIALGAARTDILRLVLRQWLLTAGAGIAIGLAVSFALTRLMSTLLYRISVTDSFTFFAGPLLFLCIAAIASYVPANRATRVDPAITLR